MPPKYRKKAKDQRATKKGWAEGAREDFLNEYVNDFANAMGKGQAAEEEVLRRAYRRYFFHFDLDDNIEPALPLKPFDESWVPPVDEGPLEELRAKRELKEKKKTAIRAWFMYRALKISSIRATVRRRMLSDAYLALLNKVGKLGKRPAKARSAFQEWQTRNKEEATRIVQDLWNVEVAAGRQAIPARGGICPKFRQEAVQKHFSSLSAETQKLWAAKATSDAEEKKAEWDRVYHGEPSKAPEDRAACVKNLPAFLQPIAEGVLDLTGLMTIVHVVGPMGALNGEIGVISVCSGKNLDPHPVSAAKWQPTVYEEWRNHLVRYANTAYTAADKEAVKLPSSPELPADFKGIAFDDDALEKVARLVDAEVAEKDTGELGGIDDEDSDDSEEDNKRKRPAASSSSTARKRQKAAGNSEEASGMTEAGKEKVVEASTRAPAQLVMVDGRWKSQYEIEREERIRKNRAILDALEVNAEGLFKQGGKAKKPPRRETKEKSAEGTQRRQSSRLNTQGGSSSTAADTGDEPMDVDQPTQEDVPMDAEDAVVPISLTEGDTPQRLADITAVLPVNPAPLSVATEIVTDLLAQSSASSPELRAPLIDHPPTVTSDNRGSNDAASQPPHAPANESNPTHLPDDLTSTSDKGTESGLVEGEVQKGDAPMVECGTQVDDEAREMLLEAPDWFTVPFRVFAGSEWGDSWKTLLESFVKLEGSVDFGIAEGTLPSTGRPGILSQWIVHQEKPTSLKVS